MSDQVSGDTTSAEQSETPAVGGSTGDEARSSAATDHGSEPSGGEGDAGAKKKRRRRRRKKKPEGNDEAAASAGGESAGNSGVEAEVTADAAKGDAAKGDASNRDAPDRGRRPRGDDRGRGQRSDARGRREGRGRSDRDDRGERGGPRRGRPGRDGGRDRDGGRGRGDGGLKVSLFAALAGSAQFDDLGDREVTCRKPGCTKTWTWSREAQVTLKLQGAKIKPPARLCDEHWAEERSLKDQPVECRVRGCERTWIWNREAQLKHRAWYEREKAKLEADEARSGQSGTVEGDSGGKKGKQRRRRNKKRLTDGPPARLCGVCEARIKHLENIEQPCKVHGCGKTWTWTKESQLEGWAPLPDHVMPNPVVAAPPSEPDAAKSHDETEVAPVRGASTEDSSTPVAPSSTPPTAESAEASHGDPSESESASNDDDPATAEASSADGATPARGKKRRRRRRGKSAGAEAVPAPPVSPLAKPPRRMCKSCVEFCRAHQDREVVCGKPDCERTWTYKVGAQLQDHLAGRTADPIKLCDYHKKHLEQELRSQTLSVRVPDSLPPGAEVMPCVVPGCTDSWVYVPGARLDGVSTDGAPVDRMCDPHRVEHGAEARDPRPVKTDAPSENAGDQVESSDASDGAQPAANVESGVTAAEVANEPSAPAEAAPDTEAEDDPTGSEEAKKDATGPDAANEPKPE